MINKAGFPSCKLQTNMVNASVIRKVERLKDQGSNGSTAYEFSTKIAIEKSECVIGTVIVGNTSRRVSEWCNPSNAPPLS